MCGKIVRAIADGSVEFPCFSTPDNGLVVYPDSVKPGPCDNAGANHAWNDTMDSPNFNPGGGNVVWINHGGIRILYANMPTNNSYNITADQKVVAGQPIGLVGFAGRISGAVHTRVHAGFDPGPGLSSVDIMRPALFLQTSGLPSEMPKVGGANEGECSKCNSEGLFGPSCQISLIVPSNTHPGHSIHSGAISFNSRPSTYFEIQADWKLSRLASRHRRIFNMLPISLGSFKERAFEARRFGIFSFTKHIFQRYPWVWLLL